jgi:ATP-dependent RNA helicase RhlE
MNITFEDLNLNSALQNALNDLGYTNPTTIQKKAFPIIMSGRDVCGIAQTGTGKTFAYLLPLLRLWKFTKEKNPQILILVPTRELVAQLVVVIKELTPYMNIIIQGIYGGANINVQKTTLETEGADVIVATPGRIYDLILKRAVKVKAINKLVIDEVDEMLNLGFRTQIKNIMNVIPARRQNLMFSATITEDIELILEEYFNNPEKVEAAPTGTPLENIEQSLYHVPNFNSKINLLTYLLKNNESMSKVLVFTASKKLADDVFEQMEKTFSGVVGVIHSNKEQNHRFNTVKQFLNGSFRFIIATDIVARGIDIEEVTHVVNFDMPDVPENYMHRIGRTGRADKNGIAINFVNEKEIPRLEAIQALMKMEVPIAAIPDADILTTVLTELEMEKVHVKANIEKVIRPKIEGGAFHEKINKNKKSNGKVSRKDKMMAKYGKPITKGKTKTIKKK